MALLDKWFREGRREAASPAAVARLQAAINWIFTQCQNTWAYNAWHIDERWQQQLVETAVFFCRDKNHVSIAEQIINDWRFQQPPQSEANRKLRAGLGEDLRREVRPPHVGRNQPLYWLAAGKRFLGDQRAVE